MPSDELVNEQTRGRLIMLRVTTVIAPWVTAASFALANRIEGSAGYAFGLPAADRTLITASLLGSGALSILIWIVLRSPRSASVRTGATTVCYVAVLWVAILGAAAWGRGAAVGWFGMTYAWALAVQYGLLPIDRR